VTVFLTHNPDGIILMARAAEGKQRGDLVRELGPGDEFLGWPYAQLRALGEGEHHITDRRLNDPVRREGPSRRAQQKSPWPPVESGQGLRREPGSEGLTRPFFLSARRRGKV
jgi:hypothetical protein